MALLKPAKSQWFAPWKRHDITRKENPESSEHAVFEPRSHPSNVAQQNPKGWPATWSRFLVCLAFPTSFLRQLDFMIPREVPQENLEREQSGPREQNYCSLVFLCALDFGLSLCSRPHPFPQRQCFRCSPIYHPGLPTPGKVMLESPVVAPPALPPAASFTKLPRTEYHQDLCPSVNCSWNQLRGSPLLKVKRKMERLQVDSSCNCICLILLGKQVKYGVEGIKLSENASEQLF